MSPQSPHSSPATRLLAWSLAFNLPLTFLGIHRRSFDYYSHLFFSDHYRLRWWDLWEPRWYTGFSVASYPPLVHQLIALLSRVAAPFSVPEPEVRLRGLAFGYALVQLAALVLFPLAMRQFASLFVGRQAADRAGFLAVFFPGLSLAAYAFGQLPTVVASLAGLLALGFGGRYLKTGDFPWLAYALLSVGVAAGAHHAAFLMLPWAGLAVVARVWSDASGAERLKVLGRSAAWASLSVGTALLVLWPFVQWSQGYEPQVPIDHPSRHNFLTDLPARTFFFWPVYGWLIPSGPFLIWLAFSHRRLAPLAGGAAMLTLLGLGGTTPLPEVLFGANWAWLTYDRFALWAGLCWLPLAGSWWTVIERRARNRRWPGTRTPEARRGTGTLLTVGIAGFALFSAFLSIFKHSQPPELDLSPIVDFLGVGDRREWRYFTFGFGDQLARLSILAPVTTPDGSYHTARTLPELRQSGIGQIDAAVWSDRGVGGAYVFMERAEQWAVHWAFVNHDAYLPLLEAAGWRYRERLSNGVEVWESTPTPPRARDVTPEKPPVTGWAAVWWGVAPMALLGVSFLLALWHLARSMAQSAHRS